MPVAQAPCPWNRDAAITKISQITCILGVKIKEKSGARKENIKGWQEKEALVRRFVQLFHTLLRYKDMTKGISEIRDLNLYNLHGEDLQFLKIKVQVLAKNPDMSTPGACRPG